MVLVSTKSLAIVALVLLVASLSVSEARPAWKDEGDGKNPKSKGANGNGQSNGKGNGNKPSASSFPAVVAGSCFAQSQCSKSKNTVCLGANLASNLAGKCACKNPCKVFTIDGKKNPCTNNLCPRKEGLVCVHAADKSSATCAPAPFPVPSPIV